jgi:uncharacterized membrane protein
MEHRASTVVDRPLSTVYNQWTQFESFPQFMEGVESVRQLDDTTTEWHVSVGGVDRSFTADIVEQKPDSHIAWRSQAEPSQAGRVAFHPEGTSTRIDLWMDFDPQGLVESAGDKLGFVQRRVEGDLERFKHFIEDQGSSSGQWRGEVHGGQSDPAP